MKLLRALTILMLILAGFIFTTKNGPHLPDGRVDHAMIVTTKDANGNIYVSYHSNDTLDRSMTDLIYAEPNANFFGDVVVYP